MVLMTSKEILRLLKFVIKAYVVSSSSEVSNFKYLMYFKMFHNVMKSYGSYTCSIKQNLKSY